MNDEDISQDSPGEESGKKKEGCFGVMAGVVLLLFIGGIITFFLWVNHLRRMHGEPDYVYGTIFTESNGRNLVYLQNAILIESDESDHLDDYTHRLDVMDLATGELVSRALLGDDSTHWLGAHGSVAWLVSIHPDYGLQACDLNTGDVLIDQQKILAKNAGVLKGSFATFQYDTRSGGVVARMSDSSYYLIEPGGFTARPFVIDSLVPPPHVIGYNATLARPIVQNDIADIMAATVTGEILTRKKDGLKEALRKGFIRPGILYDAGKNAPLQLDASGSVAVLHYEENDWDADFILTALSADGKNLWKVTEEELESEEEIRGAHMSGKELVIITDEDIIFLDPAAGKVLRRVDL